MTFVLLLSAHVYASPHEHVNETDKDKEAMTEEKREEDLVDKHHLIIADPETAYGEGGGYLHLLRSSVGLRISQYYDPEDNLEDYDPRGFGLSTTLYSATNRHLEFGAQSLFASAFNGVLYGGLRYFIDEFSRLRYFYSFGPGLLVDADESVLGFLKIDNYSLWLQAGLEYSIHAEHGVRLDLETFLTSSHQMIGPVLSYQYSW